MSFSGVILYPKLSGSILDAVDLRTRFEHIQGKTNGKFGIGDFVDTVGTELKKPVVKTEHIFKPEFFGSPSPHILGVSSDTYYRRRSGNKLDRCYRHEATGSKLMDSLSLDELRENDPSAWQPIEGLSTTVFVDPGRDAICSIMCNFYAFESGGKSGRARPVLLGFGRDTGYGNKEESISGYGRATAAGLTFGAFCIFVDKMDGNGPQIETSTFRRIFGTGGGRYRMRRMNHSMSHFIGDLSPGENKISVRCIYRQKSLDNKSMRHLYIDQRNLVVDLMYR
jgi:hypothetical protein